MLQVMITTPGVQICCDTFLRARGSANPDLGRGGCGAVEWDGGRLGEAAPLAAGAGGGSGGWEVIDLPRGEGPPSLGGERGDDTGRDASGRDALRFPLALSSAGESSFVGGEGSTELVMLPRCSCSSEGREVCGGGGGAACSK
jgi:hypothetical protein